MSRNFVTWLFACVLMTACQMGRSQSKVLKIQTTPPGAKVNVNGLLAGTTPFDCTVPRMRGYIQFEVLPPPETTERLWTQRKTFTWSQLPLEGGVLYFDLRLEETHPVQPVEVRER